MRLFSCLLLLSSGLLAEKVERGGRKLQGTDPANTKSELLWSTDKTTKGSDQEFRNVNNSTSQFEHNIVGGQKTNFGEFPAFVWGKAGCGGTLIANDVVLTAAHCEGSSFRRRVLVGAARLNQAKYGAQWRNVLKRVKHPQFDKETANFDFMVVKIEPVTNSNLKPIPINKDNTFPSKGQWLTVVGFGDTGEGTYSKRLRKAGVSAKGSLACSSAYPGQITSSMLCASAPGKDACEVRSTGDD